MPDGGAPAPGGFALDDSRRIVIAQDPAGQRAEVAVRTNAVKVTANNDLKVNVQGTANVLAGAKAAGSRRFVFVSSGGGIYGESDGAD